MEIIFVCHGSICRSPAAEFIFKKLIKEKGLESRVKVKSRALSWEEMFHDIYPPMKTSLRKHDIPFERHLSDALNTKEVIDADYVFYMDNQNRQIIEKEYYLYLDKFHPITEFNDYLDEIEDPWYTGNFDKVVEELIECITQIIDQLIASKFLYS